MHCFWKNYVVSLLGALWIFSLYNKYIMYSIISYVNSKNYIIIFNDIILYIILSKNLDVNFICLLRNQHWTRDVTELQLRLRKVDDFLNLCYSPPRYLPDIFKKIPVKFLAPKALKVLNEKIHVIFLIRFFITLIKIEEIIWNLTSYSQWYLINR